MRTTLVLLAASLLAASLASAAELVRVNVGAFNGDEPITVSSASHPTLFTLDPRIASAELTAVNPAAPIKNDHGPGTWFPALTPIPAAMTAGYLQLTVTPVGGQSVRFGAITFITQAVSPGNPSSLVLRWSKDGFASPLRVIDTSSLSWDTVGTRSTASDAATSFRWVAGNDFGDNGGGEAGFFDGVVVVFEGLCADSPRSDCDAAGSASLHLTGDADPARQRLAWSWSRGNANPSDFGFPSAQGAFGLCIYDERGLAFEAALGPERCGRKDCWKLKRTLAQGFSYKNKSGNADGLSALKVKPGDGKASISLAGVGSDLDLPLPMAAAVGVRAQLVRDGGACWDSVFETAPLVDEPLEFEAEQAGPTT